MLGCEELVVATVRDDHYAVARSCRMRKCVPQMLKMRKSVERHGNEWSPIWPCVVNNEAEKGKWLSCDLWALGFSIPACVEEGVSVVNWG